MNFDEQWDRVYATLRADQQQSERQHMSNPAVRISIKSPAHALRDRRRRIALLVASHSAVAAAACGVCAWIG